MRVTNSQVASSVRELNGLPVRSNPAEAAGPNKVTEQVHGVNDSKSGSLPNGYGLDQWMRNVVDSGFRALGRQAEVSVEAISGNQFVRVPFRFVTDFVRNGAAQGVQNILNDRNFSSGFKLNVLRRTLENAVATAFFEPNRYESSFVRVGIGFLNMTVRFAARVALVALDVLSPEDIEVESLPDEFGSKSLGRIIRPFSNNPLIGFSTRFVEQVIINFGLDKMFLRNHLLSKLNERPSVNVHKVV